MPTDTVVGRNNLELWYDTPAKEWQEALPIGNGRLGAMVFGSTDVETMLTNEDSVWYGGQVDRCSKDGYKHLQQLRSLIRQGKQVEAESLAELAFFSSPLGQRHYEPLADCTLDFGHNVSAVSDYRRALDLAKATLEISYTFHNVKYRRWHIASFVDNVMAARVCASSPGSLNFSVSLDRRNGDPMDFNSYHDGVTSLPTDNALALYLTPGGVRSNRAVTVVKVLVDDGAAISFINNHIVVKGAQEALVLCAAHTIFRKDDPEQACLDDLRNAADLGWGRLWQRHSDDFGTYFNAMSVRLGASDTSTLPTDARLQALKNADSRQLLDPDLLALYYQYGRYLMLSSSRNGPLKPLPANLQGIWSSLMQPAWGARFTININAQMNYWIANSGNLSPCEVPLFDLLERLADNGKDVAQSLYGCRGWCVHSNTDIWADCAPVDKWMPATLWTLGGPWLCLHVWDHYQFNGDPALLHRMYHVFEGCAQFYLDFLVESHDGMYFVTSPSLSPENTFLLKDGTEGRLCEGSTIDMQILRAFFTAYVEISCILDRTNLVTETQHALAKLPPMKIGSQGQLLEWQEEYEELEPGHRHTSHLWGLYPGNLISPSGSLELAEAAKITLRNRAKHGGGHTGWSRAWMINLWARLLDGNEALLHVNSLLAHSTMPNMLDIHPPFQIDGNFGGAAGIMELFVQSHDHVIRLLPALPAVSTLNSGEIKGVCIRGGFEIDFKWTDGRVVYPLYVKSRAGNKCNIEALNCKVYEHDGVEVSHAVSLHTISFDTVAGKTYIIE
ncbi:hypothetical protein Unana1_00851 [Umbelopsis nana]